MRKMSVAGTFYPAECKEIKRYIQVFDSAIKTEAKKISAKAIISPHAGYVYSGFTANAAYCLVDAKKIKRVVIIGPSHRVYLKGASVGLYESYASPCAELTIDLAYSKNLVETFDFLSFNPSAHQEHSTETQVPFVEHYFKEVTIVEIVYGDMETRHLVPLIKSILEDEETFLVMSTDLSHFYDLDRANQLDKVCLDGVSKLDLQEIEKGCEACGLLGVKALILASRELGLSSRVIDYRTSYDASSDKSRVVGYMSALIF